MIDPTTLDPEQYLEWFQSQTPENRKREAERAELRALREAEAAEEGDEDEEGITPSDVPLDPEERREWARQSLTNFKIAYFSHYLTSPAPLFHKELEEIALDLALCRGDYTDHKGFVAAAPRGFGKSSVISLFLVIYCICYQLKRFIVVFSDSDEPQAKGLAQNIKEELEDNELLREDFGDLVGDHHGFRWTGQDFDVVHIVNGRPVFKTRVLSRGVQGKVRGVRVRERRPDLVVGDDLENDSHVETYEQRQKLWNWFMRVLLPMLDARVGRILIVGTKLHLDSLLAKLLSKASEPNSEFVGRLWAAIQPDGTPLWPELWPLERLAKVRELSPLMFASEYMNDPIDEEARIVRPEWINWYTDEELTYDGERHLWYWKNIRLTIYAFIDLAVSEQEKADETCIVVGGVTPDHTKLFVLYVFHDRIDFAEQVNRCIQVYNHFRPQRFGIEDQAYQQVLHQEVRRRLRTGAKVSGVRRRGRTFDRIKGMSPLFEQGVIYLRAAGPGQDGDTDLTGHRKVHHSMAEYYRALVYYPSVKHDDMPDATEGLVHVAGGLPAFAIGTWVA